MSFFRGGGGGRGAEAGLGLSPDPEFNPLRAPLIVPKNKWKGLKVGPPGKYTDPAQNVVRLQGFTTPAHSAISLTDR